VLPALTLPAWSTRLVIVLVPAGFRSRADLRFQQLLAKFGAQK
jgi:hypothetical protein